ncbi:hypothetical protein DEO72_LG8g3030 [Vigna unguiculata]|uniref:Uncharacterized protein n=1 Tax=Vigna unguiculata TaxID=3917 RepID=A0A4D6MV35_VIGUN|nr:hypothetical protein DEO72_LG8g3030 [Vigna unguiculata]
MPLARAASSSSPVKRKATTPLDERYLLAVRWLVENWGRRIAILKERGKECDVELFSHGLETDGVWNQCEKI